MDQYKIDADRDAVGNLLRDLLKERSCSQKEFSVLIQNLLWYLAVNENSKSTDGGAEKNKTTESKSSKDGPSENKKATEETNADETERILSFLHSAEARRYFHPEESSERVIGFR